MTAGKKLTSFVHVTDDDGVTHAFGPEDKLPAWAAKKITNPAAYGDEDVAETVNPGDG